MDAASRVSLLEVRIVHKQPQWLVDMRFDEVVEVALGVQGSA